MEHPRRIDALAACAIFVCWAIACLTWMRRGFYVFDYSLYIDGAYRVAHGERWNQDFFTTWGPVPTLVQAAAFRTLGIVPGLAAVLLLLGAAPHVAYWLGPARRVRSFSLRLAGGVVVALADWVPLSFPWVDLFALSFGVSAMVIAAEREERIAHVLSGVLVGLAIVSKPNLGLAALAAVSVVAAVRSGQWARVAVPPAAAAIISAVFVVPGGASRWFAMLTLPGSELPGRLSRLVQPGRSLMLRLGVPSLLLVCIAVVACCVLSTRSRAWITRERTVLVTIFGLLGLAHVAIATGSGDPYMYELPAGVAVAYALSCVSTLRVGTRLATAVFCLSSLAWSAYVVRVTQRIHRRWPEMVRMGGWSWRAEPTVVRDIGEAERLIERHTQRGDRILVLPSMLVVTALTERRGLVRLPVWWQNHNSFDEAIARSLGQELLVQCPKLVLLRREETQVHSVGEFLALTPDFERALRGHYRELDATPEEAHFSAWVPASCPP